MARTLNEIQNVVLNEKAVHPELDSLNNNAPTSIWRLWVYIVSYAIWLHEQFFDIHKSEVQAIAERAIPGTAAWFRHQCLQYQAGYLLEWNATTLKYEYSEQDEDAKIIRYASVRQGQGGIISVKVAKEESGIPVPLDGAELSAFSGYMNQIKFAGTFLNIVSANPDLLRILTNVYYQATLQESIVRAEVEKAINLYIRSLPFDGRFQLSRLMDAIQTVDGVSDVSLPLVEAMPDAGTSFQTVSLDYFPYAGYLTIDGATPLSSSLTFIPFS